MANHTQGDDHQLLNWEGDAERDPLLQLPAAAVAGLRDSLTGEAWVHADAARAEGMMPLVSRWQPAASFDAFSAIDVGAVDGLETRGYYGAVFDGHYLYGCPVRSTDKRQSVHGCVFRYDTQADFRDPGSYQAYDAGNTGGLCTKGYYGGHFDGRYVTFIPRDDGRVHHSRFLRYDTRGEFKSDDSWSAFDAGLAHSFQGGATDGRYLYCCPGHTMPADSPFCDSVSSSVIMRYDTAGRFDDPGSYRTFDARLLGENVVCYDGAAFDGRYLFFAPLETAVVLRYDTEAPFTAADSWSTFDAGRAVGMGHLYFVPFGCANVGAVFDDAAATSISILYVYFIPLRLPRVTRLLCVSTPPLDPDSWATPGCRPAARSTIVVCSAARGV